MNPLFYPWYDSVDGDDLEQGDILESCRVFLPPPESAVGPAEEVTFRWEERDTIIMSQTCDMAKGHEKITEVILCPVWNRSELTDGHLATSKGMEDARRGNLPGFHVLAECHLPGFQREVRVVDFRRVYSLPLDYVRQQAGKAGERIRLLPPYREHLSQGFARFFMRVGLPVDIPSFQ
jgi:hypothetical protein